jgi:hypothetical protein
MKFLLAIFLSIMTALALTSVPSRAEESVKPDFSNVKSLASAQELAASGKLVKILLFPAEFGGEDSPQNITYVTPEAAQIREKIIGTLRRIVKEGLVDELAVEPEYRGDSFVPVRLVMKAGHSAKDGKFEPSIEIW